MRGVFNGIGRAVVLASVVAVLAATAATAAPRDQQGRFIDRVIAWLQSRISIPPGNG